MTSGMSRRRGSEAGYSLAELMMVVGVMGVLGSMALMQIGMSRPALKGDGGLRVVLAQMNAARELAITQRRYMRLTFTNTNQIQIVREEVPGPATTVISTAIMEGGVQFLLMSGVPDTPDAFGRGSATDFGSATQVKFAPDGTLINQVGATLNGTVFLAVPTQKASVRAATVLGSTGRIRAYKWNGNVWRIG
jgi:type II secretory pathway pseudopilin PulG